MKSVAIIGAKSLERYSTEILARGFEKCGWQVDIKTGPLTSNMLKIKTDTALIQLHGAPQSASDDKIIIRHLQKNLDAHGIILFHRPDEFQDRYPEFKNILSKLSSSIAITFLGSWHINNPFFKVVRVRKMIPHGFFDLPKDFQIDPIVVGSDTTWGEMRSVEHAIKLIKEIFLLNRNKKLPIMGFLGGEPKEQLNLRYLTKTNKTIKLDIPVEFVDAQKFNLRQMENKIRAKNIILVAPKNSIPKNLGVTFNFQLYYLDLKSGRRVIRTGESSGSVHASSGVPVIIEMNASEKIEGLDVIKVPYRKQDDFGSVDFQQGAKKIYNCIARGNFKKMLKHNFQQSKKFSCEYVAREYIRLFKALE